MAMESHESAKDLQPGLRARFSVRPERTPAVSAAGSADSQKVSSVMRSKSAG